MSAERYEGRTRNGIDDAAPLEASGAPEMRRRNPDSTGEISTSKGSEKSKFWVKSVKALAYAIGALLIFLAGMRVGELKAWFSYRWAESYSANFGEGANVPPHGGPMMGIRPRLPGRFFNGHGVYGEIMRVEGKRILVKDRDGSEKIVVITDKTTIRRGPVDISPKDVRPDQAIVVIGTPTDDGKVEASFIRLFPMGGAVLKPMPFHARFDRGDVERWKGADL